jgi:hypothetical protein
MVNKSAFVGKKNFDVNKMHGTTIKILKFIFGIELYMFWTVSPTIIRSLALYTQQ